MPPPHGYLRTLYLPGSARGSSRELAPRPAVKRPGRPRDGPRIVRRGRATPLRGGAAARDRARTARRGKAAARETARRHAAARRGRPASGFAGFSLGVLFLLLPPESSRTLPAGRARGKARPRRDWHGVRLSGTSRQTSALPTCLLSFPSGKSNRGEQRREGP